MKNATRAVLAVALAMGLNASVAISASEPVSTTPIQDLMGSNYQAVARIMAALIEQRYESISVDADILIHHSEEIVLSVPSRVQGAEERSVFVSYAQNLEAAAKQLKATAKVLANRDRPQSTAVGMVPDEVRAAAGQRLGDVVSACAVCHGEFRFDARGAAHSSD